MGPARVLSSQVQEQCFHFVFSITDGHQVPRCEKCDILTKQKVCERSAGYKLGNVELLDHGEGL